MRLFAAVSRFVERARADWDGVRLSELVFGEKDTALLVVLALVGVGLVALVARSVRSKRSSKSLMREGNSLLEIP